MERLGGGAIEYLAKRQPYQGLQEFRCKAEVNNTHVDDFLSKGRPPICLQRSLVPRISA